MKLNGWTDLINVTPYSYMDKPCEARPAGWINEDYPGIYDGGYGPTPEALKAAETPSLAFFRFAPAFMWEKIVKQTDDYFKKNLHARVTAQLVKQDARKLK
ncbi:hypothetical protein PF008_g27121 [Phytophthora fragariae]|uniref:Uncharacterized protein n=1 Tax=Phytophthora fragariae TaxID=53985 RepID=A0A6G0QFP0_9STRA|nr:hypothetical protein PF008_g27121 [Phytophthora fragariae]